MNQYKEETSQIHAPADLLLRTKQAVRMEEQRMHWEKMQDSARQPVMGSQAGDGRIARMPECPADINAAPQYQKDSGRSGTYHGKIYRWALPVAAAVMCVIVFHVSLMQIRFNKGYSSADGSVDMAAEETAGAESEASMEEAAEAEIDMAMEQGEDSAEAAQKSSAADNAAEEAEADGQISQSLQEVGLSVSEVDETPDFLDEPGTECVVVQDTRMYVTQEQDGTWLAYSRINRKRYLFRGSSEKFADQETFLEEAHALLEETIKGGE